MKGSVLEIASHGRHVCTPQCRLGNLVTGLLWYDNNQENETSVDKAEEQRQSCLTEEETEYHEVSKTIFTERKWNKV